MTDNTRMVDLPWHDGTTRTVPEWTPYMGRYGFLAFAREDGYSTRITAGSRINPHVDTSAAVHILTEAPEPPVKVDVPTGIAAVVSAQRFPNDPVYVLTRDGWRGIGTYTLYDPSEIADELRAGARVLYEGVDE